MKRFEKLRRPEVIPFPTTDDNSESSDTLCDPEESNDDETESLISLNESMTKLSLQPTKSVTFDLSENVPNSPSHDTDDSASEQSDEVESPASQNDEVNA